MWKYAFALSNCIYLFIHSKIPWVYPQRIFYTFAIPMAIFTRAMSIIWKNLSWMANRSIRAKCLITCFIKNSQWRICTRKRSVLELTKQCCRQVFCIKMVYCIFYFPLLKLYIVFLNKKCSVPSNNPI